MSKRSTSSKLRIVYECSYCGFKFSDAFWERCPKCFKRPNLEELKVIISD